MYAVITKEEPVSSDYQEKLYAVITKEEAVSSDYQEKLFSMRILKARLAACSSADSPSVSSRPKYLLKYWMII